MTERFSSKTARFLIETLGFAIFPCHTVDEMGVCSCGQNPCGSAGKHPLTENGVLDAKNTMAEAVKLWQGRSGYNVGIATGKKSNIFVLDIDGPMGEQDLEDLCQKTTPLPETLQQTTGKGRHLFFKYPQGVEKIYTRRGVIGSKIDIRGDGGYVIGQGSKHRSGAIYDFINPLESVADAPQWLIDIAAREPNKAVTGLTINTPVSKNLHLSNEWSQDQIRDMLAHINPDDCYDKWFQIGMAIKHYGLPFNVWDEWSQKGAKYSENGPNEMQKKWNGFGRGAGVTIGTLVYYAKSGGWKPQKSYAAPYVGPLAQKSVTQEQFDPETGEIIATGQQGKNGLYYINAPDITFSTSVTDFVKNTLTDGGLSVVYGESNCGKTFFMTDLAFHVVLGKPWQGKRVRQGNVLYVSMEGSFGLKNRIAAYKKEYKTDLSGFLMMPCAVDFINPEGNIAEFMSVLTEAKAKLGDIRLIVIDTLARAIGGGDENSGQDMGILVKHADMIREYTGSHVSFIHHSGKDRARGARGHSSLRAAVDTEIEISRTEGQDFSNVKIAKQRDIEIGEDTQFKLRRIVLGVNDENEEITSCVVEPYSAKDDLEQVLENKFKNNKIKVAYDALIEAIDKFGYVRQGKDLPNVRAITEDQFKDTLAIRGLLSDNPNSSRKQASRYRIDLIENKLAVSRDGLIWSTKGI